MRKLIIVLSVVFMGCQNKSESTAKEVIDTPFSWDAATVYFMLTDRFNNADTSNDINFNRTDEAGVLRGFEGGDLKGVIEKVASGYFTDLGVNAIWMTPIVEQIHGGTDEGTGVSYGFHGYWTKDWTNLDPNFGTKEDLKKLVELAHSKGIRIVLDAVINHTGPVTEKDPVWPDDWVRTGSACDYKNYNHTVHCTLVENLPDIKTESNEPVELPKQLVEKWKAEGRYEQEIAELDAFFDRTKYPRAPRFYIMKWLSDYITEFGIDGYRVDTVKHTEPYVWQEFREVVNAAFTEFKSNNPEKVLDDNDFYLVGEVYNYAISHEKAFDFGDKKVNYFDKAFNQLINFEFKWNAQQLDLESMFSKYDRILHGNLKDYSVLNYLSSHDDGQPFDPMRKKPYETATKLLLSQGAAQIYYGDESARILHVEGAVGDANLRSFMNWEAINSNPETQLVLKHWQKLGQFRVKHPAIGAGRHQMISKLPYVFSRSYNKNNFKDVAVVGLNLDKGLKSVSVSEVFKEGTKIRDAYSGVESIVKNGQVEIDSGFDILLLEESY
ncbi:alpha-amylase family glycosyl hydrolase [Tamlana sp. 2_MG-2023]|uniref:alpha-amylase family glycosyl hydrolase n=1 Tax=unclassified Tamlana TaxID=2614803 RepID=UPI0026E2EE25|nr:MULTISPECIES: alpha-amylase family glycosyl hydrolase [unclassified Tamlana]MDO6761350.1 alpha-amylase family glycosyl hydrolase [Tamlana sp. 2_MG-2023]MDO6792036.1 alpha-amylase family glycosyl hydrolase [Tamlana sp. 1_MG-2023]